MNVLNMNENYSQNEIASHVGKMLRDAFGKGPQSIYVSIDRPFIVVYLRNFLTPTEKILLNQGQVQTLQHTRDTVMALLIPEIKAYLLILTGMNMGEFYYDWELRNHSGVFVARQSEDAPAEPHMIYSGKEQLHAEIGWMSQRVQKKPDEIDSRMINSRTLLVVRSGVLIDLSKELLRLRHEGPLKQAMSYIEKKHLRDNKHIEHILNTKVVDVFVDWDFGQDKSVIVFILLPKAADL